MLRFLNMERIYVRNGGEILKLNNNYEKSIK